MMEFLSKAISPVVGLKVLAKHIADKVNHDVNKFEVHYYPAQKKIDYLVFYPDQNNLPPKYQGSKTAQKGAHLYNQTNAEKFCDVVDSLIAGKMPANAVIDLAILKYDPATKSQVFVFTKQDGKKKTEIIDL